MTQCCYKTPRKSPQLFKNRCRSKVHLLRGIVKGISNQYPNATMAKYYANKFIFEPGLRCALNICSPHRVKAEYLSNVCKGANIILF